MFSHTLEAFAHGTRALPGCWEIWNCFLRILKMRYVAWKSLYHFQGSRRYFILWYFVDHVLMLSFWWLFVDILLMYSHYCLVPNEILHIDRCHGHHDVLQILYVYTCVGLCYRMLNCPHPCSFSLVVLRMRISPASSSPNQRSISISACFKEASCTSCMSS